MGTLGFLGEWKIAEFKRAFQEMYMSGTNADSHSHGNHLRVDSPQESMTESSELKTDSLANKIDWEGIRGESTGSTTNSRVLLRNRLKVSIYDDTGSSAASYTPTNTYALNEIVLHRGAAPHLAHISISVLGRHLTHAIADGLIISTPTGSTAYSLSSGGSIIHPLVPSLLLTPICPRSLSFRALVLPGNMPISLRVGEGNRGRELDISIDGVRRKHGVGVGTEVRVLGEEIGVVPCSGGERWRGGVPCLVRGESEGGGESWVGGLNGLLKFNNPFGEDGG